ncbi:hypothetical protein DL93DRAFT_2060395, partial [Clavulina sp. PMI_390]
SGQGLIDLPRIAVIGNQSAGKSSLIEAISGITVPRAIGTCTRCPMECRLQQRSGSSWHCQVYLRLESDQDGNKLREVQETAFGPVLDSKIELEKMLRRAQLAILNPSVGMNHFVDLDVDDAENVDMPIDLSGQVAFSSNVVCVTVWGPDIPDLSFIDLPAGIIQNEVEPGSMEAVKSMVMKHIKGNCLILLAILRHWLYHSLDDIENQNAAYLARQVDPDGKRTIGVLTKPDTLQEGEERSWLEVIEGHKHKLALGYYITKQPAQKEVDAKITHQAARAAERFFFENHAPWSTCSANIRSRMGTLQLGRTLSRLLSRLIDETLPNLRREVDEQRARTGQALSRLPERLSQPPAVELLKLITSFTKELDLLAQGDQDHRELHQKCNPAFSRFRCDVRSTAPLLIAKTRAEAGVDSSSTAQFSDDSDGGDEAREPHVTRELPYNIPFSAKADLMTRSFESWSVLAEECTNTIVEACHIQAMRLAEKVFSGFAYGDLDRAVKASAHDEIENIAKSVKEHLQWLIAMERVPYTQNLHYFSSYRDKYLARFRGQRRVSASFEPLRQWYWTIDYPLSHPGYTIALISRTH